MTINIPNLTQYKITMTKAEAEALLTKEGYEQFAYMLFDFLRVMDVELPKVDIADNDIITIEGEQNK